VAFGGRWWSEAADEGAAGGRRDFGGIGRDFGGLGIDMNSSHETELDAKKILDRISLSRSFSLSIYS
jgi:hypothetical protein